MSTLGQGCGGTGAAGWFGVVPLGRTGQQGESQLLYWKPTCPPIPTWLCCGMLYCLEPMSPFVWKLCLLWTLLPVAG